MAAIQGAEAAQNAAGTNSNASTWGQVGAAYQKAHDDFQALVPPTDVADLQPKALSILAGAGRAATKISNAYKGGNASAGQAAVSQFKAEAQKLIDLGRQYTARGYTKLGS